MMTLKHIYLAGGCFWGTEHFFKQIAGVVETEVGFANGQTDNPTYEQVYTDTTGYAETVHVTYDPDKVSLEFLLHMFFVAIDPTSLNKQGHDEGTRYRTGIYYTDEGDLPIIEKVYAEEQSKCAQPFVVEKLPLQNFYPADEYLQDYLDKHPDGYCHLPKALFDFARKAKDMKIEIQTTELIRTSQSWDGVQLPDFPKGKPELTVLRMTFPIGAVTGWHHHTAVNYGIVEQGELTIVCQDGNERTFHEGEALVEVVGTIHRGENRGKKPVILNMFYFAEPGQVLTIQHPEI